MLHSGDFTQTLIVTMAQHGGLRGLFVMYVAELERVLGLSDAKAVRVKVMLEVGRCLAALSPQPRMRFPCTGAAQLVVAASRLVRLPV